MNRFGAYGFGNEAALTVAGAGAPPGSTWDPAAKGTLMVLSNGNYDARGNGAGWTCVRGTAGKTTGKVYFEVKAIATETNYFGVGFMDDYTAGGAGLDAVGPERSWGTRDNGYNLGTGEVTIAGTGGFGAISVDDILQVAADVDNKLLWIGHNNSWLSSGDPAAGTNAYITNWSAFSTAIFPAFWAYSNVSKGRLQTGAGSQAYSPPTGFSAWG